MREFRVVVFLREGVVSVVVFGLLVMVLMVVIVVIVAVVAVVVFAVVLIMQDGPKVEAEVPEPGVLGLEGHLVVLASTSPALDVANVKETHVECVEEALEVVVELGARDGAGEVVHAGDVGPVVDGRLLGRELIKVS